VQNHRKEEETVSPKEGEQASTWKL